MVNDVRFEISKEDLASGPGLITQELLCSSFVKVKKGQRKLLTQTSEEGQRVPTSLVLARELYTFLIGHYSKSRSSLVAQDGKTSSYNAGDLGSIPKSGRSPGEGKGNPLQYSCLENPTDVRAW